MDDLKNIRHNNQIIMYYQIYVDNQPKVTIVANNDKDANTIAHELYPSTKVHVQSINKEKYHGNSN